MTEREQLIEDWAEAFADNAMRDIEFLTVAENGALDELVGRCILAPDDTAVIHAAATQRMSFNPATHVAITKEKHERLLDRGHFLECLQGAGIDNSPAYDEGCRIYREEKGDD